MQEEKEKEDLEFITKYNGHWTVQAAVVGSAIVLLLVILIYIHFDETLTKFVEDTKKAYKDLVKEVKLRIRRKYLKMTGKTKSLVAPEIIAKIRAIGQISLAFKVNKVWKFENFSVTFFFVLPKINLGYQKIANQMRNSAISSKSKLYDDLVCFGCTFNAIWSLKLKNW